MSNKFTPGPWVWPGFTLESCQADHGELLWYTTDDDGVHCRDADKALIAQSPAMYEALEKSTRYLIGERDALYDGCTNEHGQFMEGEEGDNDREAVNELGKLINDNQQTLKAAGGE